MTSTVEPAAPVSASEAPTAAGDGGSSRSSRAPWAAVIATVVVAFGAYTLLASAVESPRVFSDELLYFDAAAAVVEGDGLSVRGQAYRHAPLYPALLVPVHRVAVDREAAYQLAKALNALLFALSAVPWFLLARRVLRAWPSAAVAALGVAIPSASYVSVVMTEAFAYLACSWAFYAIALALERPTVLRQIAALLAITVATGVRTQFVVLFGVYLLGLVLVALIIAGRRRRSSAALASLWPSWAAVGLGAGVFFALVLGPGSSSGPLGVYSVLWRSYDPVEVGWWLVYHVANIELYLAVVPLMVAPIALALMFAQGRRGDERQAAYVALFSAANVVFLLLTSAFNSTEYAVDVLHDRALFYVVPLWLIVFLVWLCEGAPKPLIASVIGGVLALVLPVLLPFSEYAKDDARQQFNGVGSTLWASVNEAFAETPVPGRLILVTFVLALVLATAISRARARLLPMAVVTVFVLAGALNWQHASRVASSWATVLPSEDRQWVDELIPDGRSVTVLAALESCPDFNPRDGFYLSEFFNESITRAGHVGTPPDSLPAERVRLARDGHLALSSGASLVADYVLAQPGVQVEGRRVAEGTSARLALWEVGGVVRTAGVDSTPELEAIACGRT